MDPSTSTDPATGQPLPEDAIQRVLFLCPKVHVYNIPPLTSTKGYTAAQWTAEPDRLIFTGRARLLETAWEDESLPEGDPARDRLKADIILEDPSTGQLFAAAPYTSAAVVEPVLDSSRFFALRVQDPSGRKAFLGIGFEDRSEAFDFGLAVQETKKALGLDGGSGGAGGAGVTSAAPETQQSQDSQETKRDLSLKEGETITVNIGGKFGRRRPQAEQQQKEEAPADLSAFSLPPPPSAASASSGGNSMLPPPPPPSSSDARAQQRAQKRMSAQDLGFDDGKFGEFA